MIEKGRWREGETGRGRLGNRETQGERQSEGETGEEERRGR